MSKLRKLSLKPEQLLSLAVEALHKTFYGTSRDVSKQIYKDLEKGKNCSLFTMKITGGNQIKGELSLDKSEFVGRINYSHFREALEVLLKRVVGKLQKKEDLNLFTNQETGELIYHIPGFVENEGQVNILVLGAAQNAPGSIQLKLMFLDPSQFKKQP